MLLPYTTLVYYGPAAAAIVIDSAGELTSATPRQLKTIAISVTGTGTADILRPYRGYAAALATVGEGYQQVTPHQLLKVKLTVDVGATPSAEDIAQAVWNGLSSKFNYANTMGSKLNLTSSPTEIATTVLSEAVSNPIHSNIKKMNSTTVYGTGVEGDKWRGFV